MKFSNDTIIKAAGDQVSSELVNEVVILNLKDGVYYGLDSVGARIWQLIQQPRAVSEVRDHLLAEYDVAPEQVEQDLLDLLEDLQSRQLIEVNQ